MPLSDLDIAVYLADNYFVTEDKLDILGNLMDSRGIVRQIEERRRVPIPNWRASLSLTLYQYLQLNNPNKLNQLPHQRRPPSHPLS